MASSFVQDLWESVFTPGPTPSLLRATNATFGCLQVVLGLLLAFGPQKAHFSALSFLCAGLWWSINWFATELSEAQRRQSVDDARTRSEPAAAATADSTAVTDHSDTDTEVEAAHLQRPPGQLADDDVAVDQRPAADVRQRTAPGVSQDSRGTPSSASTEDEWEKVSENEKDK